MAARSSSPAARAFWPRWRFGCRSRASSSIFPVSPSSRGSASCRRGHVRVGALTTHRELGAHPDVCRHVPLLAEAVPLIAHAAIRNLGTIGGSLAYADAAAELPACCVALEARIIAVGPSGERTIPAASFFTGLFTTALAENELIRAVEFPCAAPGDRSTIIELTRRSGDYAMAGLVARTLHRRAVAAGIAPRLFWRRRDACRCRARRRTRSARPRGARRKLQRRKPHSIAISTRRPTSMAARR